MIQRHHSTLTEAAACLLDTLEAGRAVILEITAQDEATGGLLRLITAIHELAQTRRLGIAMEPVGERGLRLRLTGP